MKYHFKFLSLALVFVTLSQGFLLAQYNYGPETTARIKEERARELIACMEWDRKALYEIGMFYLNLYERFQDTSLNAAIRCFKQSCFSEGDLMEEGSLQAAWNLGRIYENGTGGKKDTLLSMIYYFISDSMGRSDLERVRSKCCTSEKMIMARGDSMLIMVNPFCEVISRETIAFLSNMGKDLQLHPQKTIHIEFRIPNEFINSYYNYWLKSNAFNKFTGQAKKYMGDIDPGRFSYEVIYGENETLFLGMVISSN